MTNTAGWQGEVVGGATLADEKAAVLALIESMLLRHQARRLTAPPPDRGRAAGQ